MEHSLEQLRGVLISVQGGKILLPNANVAEIITYSAPEAVVNKPAWFLGAIRWKGYRLPLISLASINAWHDAEPTIGAKIAILKALSGDDKLSYFALLTQGFPRLVNIDSDQLQDMEQGNASDALYVSALLNDDVVCVPHLEMLEQLILQNL